MTRHSFRTLFFSGLLVTGLMPAVVSSMAHADGSGAPTAAQPTLPQEKLSIRSADGTHDFTVELAKTPHEQEVGEMFRTNVPADQGMLFVWDQPQQSDMWMENTLVSLDIVFIGADGRITSITENAVPQSLARISSHGPVAATLELQGGLTAKLGITVGDVVMSPALTHTPAHGTPAGVPTPHAG
ncbi:hypothetical protein AA0472_0247 [Acetobacter estunensis NRIC 0472]|nr:hypothetical protein AA0472_0247 [Acetobacter estunensis NRIC 0472]